MSLIPRPGATEISQEQSAELGYSSGYPGEKMVPLSDVMLPPQGAEAGRGERETEVYISAGQEYSGSDMEFHWNQWKNGIFHPLFSASLLNLALSPSPSLPLVPWRLSELKISQ